MHIAIKAGEIWTSRRRFIILDMEAVEPNCAFTGRQQQQTMGACKTLAFIGLDMHEGSLEQYSHEVGRRTQVARAFAADLYKTTRQAMQVQQMLLFFEDLMLHLRLSLPIRNREVHS